MQRVTGKDHGTREKAAARAELRDRGVMHIATRNAGPRLRIRRRRIARPRRHPAQEPKPKPSSRVDA